MTTTNEPTTTPEVPAWLDLDAIVPEKLRDEIHETIAYFKGRLPALRIDALRLVSILEKYEDTIADSRLYGPIEGLGPYVADVVGIDELTDLGWLLHSMFTPDPQSTIDGIYSMKVAERFGVELPHAYAHDDLVESVDDMAARIERMTGEPSGPTKKWGVQS